MTEQKFYRFILKKASSEPYQNNAMATDFDYRFLWMQNNKKIDFHFSFSIKTCHNTKNCPILAVILIIGKMQNL